MTDFVYGPTFKEMLYPDTIKKEVREKALKTLQDDPLNPVNLYNITWKNKDTKVNYMVIPKEFTGVEANIIVLFGKNFPTGSHKVGATYSVCIEKQLKGEITPGQHTLVWPSTGNYGIGGAWVGPRMGYDSLVLLPELMSQERFDKISSYGAKYIKTPGCESNVKEIYDETKRLSNLDHKNKILNQFEQFGNYRFHYFVTGNSIIEAVEELKKQNIGNGRVAAYASSMGSSGTIGAGDRIKQKFYEAKIVGLEPIQCPTLFNNGYGGHDIQGIGDKHVTWIHNVMNMDAMICLDDIECKKGLQLITDEIGMDFLAKELKISEDKVKQMAWIFGISGVCNMLGSIKIAKFYEFGSNDNIVTIATDSIDRYYSVMKQLDDAYGKMDKTEAKVRWVSIFENAKIDWIQEGTVEMRKRWHNLKYYTWVEQQGKTVQELNEQKSQEFWLKEQALINETDAMLIKQRER